MADRLLDQFVRGRAEKLLTYALGRGVEYQDMPLVRSIARDAAKKRQQVLGARPRRREEQAVPDEYEDAGTEPFNLDYGQSGTRKGATSHVHHEKTHSAPDVPAGRRRHAGAAAARRDDAGGDAAGADARPAPKPRFVGIFFPHGMAPGLLGARDRKARCRRSCRYILESLEKVKDQTVVLSGLWSKSAEPPEGTTGSDHWVAAAFLTGIKPRKTAGLRRDGRQPDDRSDHRAEDRPGDAAAVAAARRRGSELELEQLRRRLQLLVHELDLVDRLPTPANEPSQRTSPLPMELNPQVVFERLFGSGATPEVRAAAHAAEPQHPRFGARRAARA